MKKITVKCLYCKHAVHSADRCSERIVDAAGDVDDCPCRYGEIERHTMKKPKKSWKITGTQVAPMPYNSKGQELTFYLEKMPESSQPTVFISAYCSDKGDAAFIEKTAKEIERLLNV